MVRTRVVLSKNRASSRAGTEPRDTRVATEPRGTQVATEPRATEVTEPRGTRVATEPRRVRAASVVVSGTIDDDARLTSPFPSQPDPTEAAPRESDPYLEMEVSTEPDHPVLRAESVMQTVPVPMVDAPEPTTTLRDALPTRQLVKTVPRPQRLGAGSGTERAIVEQAKNPYAAEESSDVAMQKLIETLRDFTEAEPTPKELKWVGVVVSRPEIGASLLIGTWLRKDFRVTTPVAVLFEREDGLLVQTTARTRYFVKHAGDVYLVR